jgi:S-adenosylmethionine:tRNA ribosyltransferase-isomerase
MFKISNYDYQLPPELIAQRPTEQRDGSRLMVLDRVARTIQHKKFSDIVNYFRPGDLLVLNNSKVIPARLIGRKINNGNKNGAVCEVLLLLQESKQVWEALVKPGKRLKIGSKIVFGRDELIAEIIGITEYGSRKIKFDFKGDFYKIIEDIGLVPLPPYIKSYDEIGMDNALAERYQTVYADKPGSSAAPTAGLHFTTDIFEELHERGVKKTFVTLHTGLGTFKPIDKDDIREHKMHREWYEISAETIELIKKTKANKGRVFAVGTTSARVLETIKENSWRIAKNSKITDHTELFIYPGYKFKVIDGLITNFHLPRSTLLVLVSAFGGKEFIREAYAQAIAQKYRFYSFGDAMLLL